MPHSLWISVLVFLHHHPFITLDHVSITFINYLSSFSSPLSVSTPLLSPIQSPKIGEEYRIEADYRTRVEIASKDSTAPNLLAVGKEVTRFDHRSKPQGSNRCSSIHAPPVMLLIGASRRLRATNAAIPLSLLSTAAWHRSRLPCLAYQIDKSPDDPANTEELELKWGAKARSGESHGHKTALARRLLFVNRTRAPEVPSVRLTAIKAERHTQTAQSERMSESC